MERGLVRHRSAFLSHAEACCHQNPMVAYKVHVILELLDSLVRSLVRLAIESLDLQTLSVYPTEPGALLSQSVNWPHVHLYQPLDAELPKVRVVRAFWARIAVFRVPNNVQWWVSQF